MRITIVSNNWTTRRSYVAEHGLSILVGWKRKRILFDTGQGLALPSNLGLLKHSAKDIDSIVISHGHYDHGGALEWLQPELESEAVPLYGHPDIVRPRFARSNGTWVQIGINGTGDTLPIWSNLQLSPEPREILEGMWLTGEIPSNEKMEPPTPDFYIDKGKGRQPDSFEDEQALFCETKRGLVVVTGCAHRGLISTCEQAQNISGIKQIHAVIGGFHLRSSDKEKIDWTVDKLREWKVKTLVPMHCTGEKAIFALKDAFPSEVKLMGAGDYMDL